MADLVLKGAQPEEKRVSITDDNSGLESQKQSDKEDLAQMGYVVELPRKFNVLSALGIGYSICTAPTAMIVALAVIIGSGGQAEFIWGQLLIYFIALCVAVSLAELASAYPNAGGQYYWAAMLAPKSCSRFAAFVVGYLSWFSTLMGCASVLLACAEMAVSMWTVTHPDTVVHPWINFVIFQIINIFMFVLNCWEFLLPRLSRMFLFIAIAAAAIIFVSILAKSPSYQPASFVFAGFTNLTGWNDGVAFLTGLLGVNWGFSCLDAVTHLAEEIPEPRRNIPKALFLTVLVNAVLAWPMAIAIVFCIQNLDGIFEASTGLPSLNFFLQCFSGSPAGPFALQSLLFLGSLGAIFGTQTWQARLAWAIARDNGFPFSAHIKRVTPAPYCVPLYAHLWSSCFVALLGCLYLGSSVAFNSFVSGGIVLQYVSYSICIISMLIRGRSTIPRGPFWMGKLGLFCNLVTIAWTCFSLVFYSFPPYYPVTPTTMNYLSVCVIGFVILFTIYYLAVARKTYTGPPRTD